jgi:hypothetical protein
VDGSLMRRLLCTRRRIPEDLVAAYLDAWSTASAAVFAVNGRAWIFRATEDSGQFLEFIEWSGMVAPFVLPEVRRAIDSLTQIAPVQQQDEWEEA